MSFINPQAKEINCKIVYYGPPHAGKSTTLRQIYEKTAANSRGKIVSLSDKENQSLFFDFLPLSLGTVKGHTIRFHLYTVPGQVLYDSARKIILKGVDAVIFVADSRIERLEENLASWKNLDVNLKNHDVNPRTAIMAIQYNKRDLTSILPAEEMRPFLNTRNIPEFETVATEGRGVMECFQAVAKRVLVEAQSGE